MDEVVEQFEKTKKEWDELYTKTQHHINSIEQYGKSKESSTTSTHNSLLRLNGLAQDGLAFLNSLQFKLDLLAPQLPSVIKLRPLRLCFNLGKIKSKSTIPQTPFLSVYEYLICIVLFRFVLVIKKKIWSSCAPLKLMSKLHMILILKLI